MSIDELASATGVERERIRELESFRHPRFARDRTATTYYDGDDFVVLSIVQEFFKFGIEPRHLTMYRHFAEREATFFEGIVMPVLRQRNPDARADGDREPHRTAGDLPKAEAGAATVEPPPVPAGQ